MSVTSGTPAGQSSAQPVSTTEGGSSVVSVSVPASKSAVKEAGSSWANKLDPSAIAAVRSYTGTAYANINATLRGIEQRFDDGNDICAITLHQSLGKAELPCDCTVYRGTSNKALGALRFLPDSMIVGKTIMDEGFMSTSLNPSDAFGGDILLEIDAPSGSHGAYVGSISSAGHHESEVLFDAGQIMTIVGASHDNTGRRIIKVRLLK